MTVHINSLTAYYDDIKKFSQREKLIYGHIAMSKDPLTDRQVKDALFGNSGDMNLCRPRISDLMKKGWLKEVGKVRWVTGKNVRLVRAVSAEEKHQAEGEPQMVMVM